MSTIRSRPTTGGIPGEAPIHESVTLEAGGWEVIKKYVELGMGISIVTDICLTGSEKLVRIPLNQYFPQRGYGLVLRKGRFLSPQARRFVEILNEVYGLHNSAEKLSV